MGDWEPERLRGILHGTLVQGGRTVVRHDHLEAPIVLRCQATQHRNERVAAVVGGDDDGDQIGQWHF